MATQLKYELWKLKAPGVSDSYQLLPAGHPIAPEIQEFMEKMPWTPAMENELLEAMEKNKKA